MKVVILAGGLGSRLSEETAVRPKPMVEIGGRPMLWHIMKIYAAQGLSDFVVCLGYKGYVIKEFFANFFLHSSDITFDLSNNTSVIHHAHSEPWRVTLVDTGQASMTGGRLRRVSDYVDDAAFCFTYGDAVADVDIGALVDHHRSTSAIATVTAVKPPARWGELQIDDDDKVLGFKEKPASPMSTGWINGGFFVLEPDVFSYIEGDDTAWEGDPMINLASDGRLSAYRHEGFWQAMDTVRDRNQLEDLWSRDDAPWKLW